MRIFSIVSIFIALLFCVQVANALDIEATFKKGVIYFQANRYNDSENELTTLVNHLEKNRNVDLPAYYYAILYLALSKSEQGKTDGVSELFLKRIQIGKKQFGPNSLDTANNLMSLAETMFREGRSEEALKLLDQVETIYKEIEPAPVQGIEFLAKNRMEYTSGPFDKEKLPFDLSDFYSSCESIVVSKPFEHARSRMRSFVEVGVNYKPEGMWADIFNSANLLNIGSLPKYESRHIFIPKPHVSMRDEWCVVFVNRGLTVAAFTHEG